jgi:hypothetical protein
MAPSHALFHLPLTKLLLVSQTQNIVFGNEKINASPVGSLQP